MSVLPPALPERQRARVLHTLVDATDAASVLASITHWAGARESRTVCFCNVHSAVTALQDAALAGALSEADLALPDGAPVAWTLRRRGHGSQRRISGPDLMLQLCKASAAHGLGVFLFGSTPQTLALLRAQLTQACPGLHVAGTLSPRFGTWDTDTEAQYVAEINASGAGIVFVGLGCPRQEIWMARMRGRVQGVMLGVGAAFDFHAGTVRRAPAWMRHSGLEWLHRLASEPRRLWRRYLVTNSVFMLHTARDLLSRHGG